MNNDPPRRKECRIKKCENFIIPCSTFVILSADINYRKGCSIPMIIGIVQPFLFLNCLPENVNYKKATFKTVFLIFTCMFPFAGLKIPELYSVFPFLGYVFPNGWWVFTKWWRVFPFGWLKKPKLGCVFPFLLWKKPKLGCSFPFCGCSFPFCGCLFLKERSRFFN